MLYRFWRQAKVTVGFRDLICEMVEVFSTPQWEIAVTLTDALNLLFVFFLLGSFYGSMVGM